MDPRKRAVLDRLEEAVAGRVGADDQSRSIWRAGELSLSEAEPLLLRLLEQHPRKWLRRYCIVWALGRCGSQAAIDALARVQETGDGAALRRIAAEARRRLCDDQQREDLVDSLIQRLPPPLDQLARAGSSAEVLRWLTSALGGEDAAVIEVVHSCYLIDNEHVRPALLEVARTAPMKGYAFGALRQLFKAAEFRRDAELFGLLAYRFEKERPNSWFDWYPAGWTGGGYRTDRQPFSGATRTYLRRRVWRTLRRLAELSDSDFVSLAVAVLLPFSDDDAGLPVRRRYDAGRYEIVWDRFAGYWALNHLLYGKSARYAPDRFGRAFRCRGGYRPGNPPPVLQRGESEGAFAELWKQRPESLLRLLRESRCEPVHGFAAQLLAANEAFVDALSKEVLGTLLAAPYGVTAQLAFESASRRYDASAPDIELLVLLTSCSLAEARAQVHRWIEADRRLYLDEVALLATLACSEHEDNRCFARQLLQSASLSKQGARTLIGRLIAALVALGPDDGQRAGDISETLRQAFAGELSQIGVEVIRDLISHPLGEVVVFGGLLLLDHTQLAARAPDDLILALIDAEHEAARGCGVELLGRLTDGELLDRGELLEGLAAHRLADLRAAVRPVIERLVLADVAFARALTGRLVGRLQRRAAEGVHDDLLLLLLSQQLADQLSEIPADGVFRLLNARSPQAQQLGGQLLVGGNVPPTALSIQQIVKLASHEVLAVRQASWALLQRSVARVRQQMADAVRVLDASWQDSRQWAFGFFGEERFGEEALTPPILVSICDSVWPETQAFGRELIARSFDSQQGELYLLQLSEHPSATLQLFATDYLERHAAGSPQRLAELRQFFVTVLSRVNRGRVAKQRCIAFLADEAQKSEAAARVVAGIFARQSVTCCIGDRAAMIAAMLQIRDRYPNIALPLSRVELEVRGVV